MRKLGTITAALGFIYLGIWMIFANINDLTAAELFKWWPVLIILLGIEILIYFGRKTGEERVGFNYFVIVIFLLFLGINTVQFVEGKIGGGIRWIENNTSFPGEIEFFNDINKNKYRVINSETVLEADIKNINLSTDNGDIKVKKSTDKKVKIETSVYVDKDFQGNKYDINVEKNNESYDIYINEAYIKKAEINIYIPEDYNIKVDSDNVRIKGEESLTAVNYDIKASNASIDLLGGIKANLDFDNGAVKIRDIEKVNINSNNSSVNLDGSVEDIQVEVNNGAVNINNNICKNVDIDLNLGAVKINTEDKNIDLDIDMEHGPVDINGEKRVNSSVKKILGNGENKIKIRVNNGAIVLKNQE